MSDFQQSEAIAPHFDGPYRLHKTVAMVGMMGAGKTAVGRALAQRLGVPFQDSDAEIVDAANMSIPEIFARFGEPFFRDKEAQVIERLLTGTPCILSTGGGAFLAETNREAITAKGVSLWLDADLELLWSRVKHRNSRPLLQTDNPKETLRALFESRVPTYGLADVRVQSLPGLSIQDMVGRVIKALLARPDVVTQKADT